MQLTTMKLRKTAMPFARGSLKGPESGWSDLRIVKSSRISKEFWW